MLGSCFDGEVKTLYKIPAGEHYSLPREVTYIDHNPFTFYACFDETATYCPTEDINKLLGFTDCNSTVHEDSARFGWRWWNGRLEVFAYVYANGERDFQIIGSVPLSVWVKFQIKLDDNSYIFRIEPIGEISMRRTNNCNRGVYLQLNPYFGGDGVCDRDIFIGIKTF